MMLGAAGRLIGVADARELAMEAFGDGGAVRGERRGDDPRRVVGFGAAGAEDGGPEDGRRAANRRDERRRRRHVRAGRRCAEEITGDWRIGTWLAPNAERGPRSQETEAFRVTVSCPRVDGSGGKGGHRDDERRRCEARECKARVLKRSLSQDCYGQNPIR